MSKWTLGDSDKQNFAMILSGSLAGLVLMALLAIVALIVTRGLAHFWLQPAYFVTLQTETGLEYRFANIEERDIASNRIQRVWLHDGTYFSAHGGGKPSVVDKSRIVYLERPENLAEFNMQDGSFLLAIPQGIVVDDGMLDIASFDSVTESVQEINSQISDIQLNQLAPLHESLAEMRLQGVDASAPAYKKVLQQFQFWQEKLDALQVSQQKAQVKISLPDGESLHIPVADIQSLLFPNAVSLMGKMQYFFAQIWLFVSESPKQAITAGGVFPALFGTVLMVMLMTVMVTPFGVLAAIYLAEYAPNNIVVSIVRIAVGNLAGVPSIVYGVFGLGFFVYTVGGQLDTWLFPERTDAAVFGAPGLLWASLTMALLTLPVVIVATEEGLRRVPFSLRQGSYALGATKLETIRLTVLPLATPGIMTGVILAIARGAGEVAPLLMLGAVKFALLLPIDGEFPYIHLERQFMHLGVLIYDGAFHSQSAGQEASLMFAACLLLLLVVLVLNTIAVNVRNRLRNQYKVLIGN
ncbi:phosphate ABC transporter permease PstA [Paraneptunicella aestuarii]|uniref:phosphate ABC transporter permease PstA n=1 Tax=Paraneptunicella aestuarii TaxID=2831148 RepID=UPI001E342D1F|nr:phosphate ABC transporter permease PstA [Paraneptunicella aestuarii]UAA37984.1 phosphate ABC transporter permease PstA [Paraneptunicella aestuarii]